MKKYSNLGYLRLSGLEKFAYNIALFVTSIPMRLWGLLKAIGRFFKKLGIGIKNVVVNIFRTFFKPHLSFHWRRGTGPCFLTEPKSVFQNSFLMMFIRSRASF